MANKFHKPTKWRTYNDTQTWVSFDAYPRVMADVNGDGKADIIGFGEIGTYVALSDGGKFLTPTVWSTEYGSVLGGWGSFDKYPRTAADVNGDGKADIIGFGDDGTYVSLSDGTQFLLSSKWIGPNYGIFGGWNSYDVFPRAVADVNGDGKADIIGFASAGVHVALSNGTHFYNASQWTANFGIAQGWGTFDQHPRAVADVDGDGKADIIGFANSGAVVAISTGASFLTPSLWIGYYGASFAAAGWVNFTLYPRAVADVNGDGKADITGFNGIGPIVALSNGTNFLTPTYWITGYNFSQGWSNFDEYPRIVADVNGDNKADVIGFGAEGVQVSLSATTSFAASSMWIANFGATQTLNNFNIQPKAFGDVNGDGKADLIEFNYDGTYVSLSDGVDFLSSTLWISDYAYYVGGWTNFNAYPRIVADVNGDGKADIIGFGESVIFVSLSNGTKFLGSSIWSIYYASSVAAGAWNSFDIYPRTVADVNGDGKADIIGFKDVGTYVSLSNGTHFLIPSLWIPNYSVDHAWGNFNSNPRFVADVNGDGKADIIGIANGGVFVSLSDGTQFLGGVLWFAGLAPDQTWHNFDGLPRVIADVNGDGKADIVGFSSIGTEVVLSDGTKFLALPTQLNEFGHLATAGGWFRFDTYPRFAADIDGDGRADIIGINGAGVFVSLHSTQTISLSSSLTTTITSTKTNSLSSSLSSTETDTSTLSLTNSESHTFSSTNSQTATSSLTLSTSEIISKSKSAHTSSLSLSSTYSMTLSLSLTNSKTDTFSSSLSRTEQSISTSQSLHATSLSIPDSPTLSRTNDKIPTSSNTISQSGKFTATKYSSTIAPVGEIIPEDTHTALPVAVIESAKTVAAVGSVASVVTFSVSNVAQSARIATVSNLVTCAEGEPLTSGPLSWYMSPTQMSVGDTRLKYVDGAVLGNWVLFGGLSAVHSALAYNLGADKLTYPSALVVYSLFLSSQTAQASTNMIRFGDTGEIVGGSLSLGAQAAGIIVVAVFLKQGFEATTEVRKADYLINKVSMFAWHDNILNPMQQKWLPLVPGDKFVKHHGMLFKDYRIEWYGFIVLELSMAGGTGIIDAFNVEADSCSNIIYAASSVYGVFAVANIGMHPHRHPLEKGFAGGMAALQFTAISIATLQHIFPSLKENLYLQTAAETIPVILNYASFARSVYDLASYTYAFYKFINKKYFKAEEGDNDSESSEDDIAKLLLSDDDDPAPRDGDIQNNDENFVADGKHGLLTGGMFAGAAAISPSALSTEVQSLLDSLLDNNENPQVVDDIINGVTINVDEAAIQRNPASIYKKNREDIEAAVEASGEDNYDDDLLDGPQPAGYAGNAAYTNQQRTLDDILDGPQPAGYQAAPATSQADMLDRLLDTPQSSQVTFHALSPAQLLALQGIVPPPVQQDLPQQQSSVLDPEFAGLTRDQYEIL
jgi:hypothetical protein